MNHLQTTFLEAFHAQSAEALLQWHRNHPTIRLSAAHFVLCYPVTLRNDAMLVLVEFCTAEAIMQILWVHDTASIDFVLLYEAMDNPTVLSVFVEIALYRDDARAIRTLAPRLPKCWALPTAASPATAAALIAVQRIDWKASRTSLANLGCSRKHGHTCQTSGRCNLDDGRSTAPSVDSNAANVSCVVRVRHK